MGFLHKTGKYVEVFIFTANSDVRHVELLKNTPKKLCITNFAKFVKSGKVRFKEVDISTPQGEKIADKYRVSWSSLYVNGWNNGKEKRNDLTRMGFKYARNNTAQI